MPLSTSKTLLMPSHKNIAIVDVRKPKLGMLDAFRYQTYLFIEMADVVHVCYDARRVANRQWLLLDVLSF